ncbi:MAG: hypothetical protein NC452_16965 [Eubacterium sp.]|nr:hypothetical protein [Eubacterium sp.]
MTKFEVGKKYATRSICNSECVWSYTVIARTEKTVTISDGKETKKCRINEKLSAYRSAETILPEGNYSMCPVLDASKIA